MVIAGCILKGLFVGINMHEERVALPWEMEGEARVGAANISGDNVGDLGHCSVHKEDISCSESDSLMSE